MTVLRGCPVCSARSWLASGISAALDNEGGGCLAGGQTGLVMLTAIASAGATLSSANVAGFVPRLVILMSLPV
jgi:hypothetical protein